MSEAMVIGPLLAEVLEAHETEELILGPASLGRYAKALVQVANGIAGPVVVWPIGPAAERLVGAASVLAPELKIWNRHERIDGQTALLFGVAMVTPLALVEAAAHARALGARTVHGAGVGVKTGPTFEDLDSYADLVPSRALGRASA